MSNTNPLDSRRDFLKKAALLGAGCTWAGGFPASIQRAMAIDPPTGTTYQDAEHVVILMQENRSFDHCYGTLRGVRGFNDPRAVSLPNSNPVWLQTNQSGDTYAPFHLDIHDSKITWMGSLPHSWSDQVEARNQGKHDRWLDAKPSGHKEYAHLPLTMGYYTRSDLPFYYALADAFTVCDQNFCSSLTGTTPNRLYLWTGTIREAQDGSTKANVWNSDVDYGAEAGWTTFPERLEDAGISWRIYQNELSLDTGLEGEAEGWLANFTDNPIEWFKQYKVRFSASYRAHLPQLQAKLSEAISKLDQTPNPSAAESKKLASLRARLARVQKDREEYSDTAFAKLDARTRNLHQKAFTTNATHPDYRELTTMDYQDGTIQRQMKVPKGDVLHQFRQDVREDKLPKVSWIVAPEKFSDHPGAPWYGAWYLSETLDILTQNPKIWQKTIFILCYDENDGLFDHIPPFVPPLPQRPETGKVSEGINTASEMGPAKADGTAQPIGLGFRVPLVIASPWSRGGYVCSEVFDHTSILQFLEHWLTLKSGQKIEESNISSWRRTVCGNLTSVFRPYRGEAPVFPQPVAQAPFFQSIHQAQFKPVPTGFRKWSPEDYSRANTEAKQSGRLARQEPGTRPSCPLPYELGVDGFYSRDRKGLIIRFKAGNRLFGERAAGAPLNAYAPGRARRTHKEADFETGITWNFAVMPGRTLEHEWGLSLFEKEIYRLRFHGPNGFYREFTGNQSDPEIEISLSTPSKNQWKTQLHCINRSGKTIAMTLRDNSYRGPQQIVHIPPQTKNNDPHVTMLDLEKTKGWYDLLMTVDGHPEFQRHYAGRIEVGLESFSDPAMS